ncbi:MAG: alcohol dehydrogenase catalytic domain-containing protein, partial [Nitrospirota bacterium]
MKSAILISPKVMEINRKALVPVPGPGEVVVAVKAALTCGTDIKAYLRGHPKIPMPSPLGHEFSGDIYKIGEGVEGWAEGEPVMAVHSAPCGECAFCRMGRENLCSTIMDEKVLGAYAEFIKLPARIVKTNMFRKPESIPYPEAAMLEPLSCVVHGARMTEAERPKNVLILGAGPIGLMYLMLYKMNGAKVMIANSRSSGGGRADRLETARDLGADAVLEGDLQDIAWKVTEETEGLGADLVIEATGNKEIWESSPSLARRGGTVLLFGGCPTGTRACFDAGRIHYDEIKLMGAFHFTPSDVKTAYELLLSGKLNVSKLISGRYHLDDLQIAFDELIGG